VKLNVKAMALSWAILWGATIFLTGLANLIWAGYAQEFLKVVASIYPGYHATPSFVQVIIGTLYAIADGFFGGWIFAWLYNRF
jgi:hypothetical protein